MECVGPETERKRVSAERMCGPGNREEKVSAEQNCDLRVARDSFDAVRLAVVRPAFASNDTGGR